jgi:thiol:disulfide interchange protein
MTPSKNLRFSDPADETPAGNLWLTLSTLRSMTGRRAISALIAAKHAERGASRAVVWAVLGLVGAPFAFATSPPEPLSVDAAFPLTASFVNQTVSIRVDVQPGHYLYSDRFDVKQDGAPAVELQRLLRAGGKPKQDPNFGLVKVYTKAVNAQVKPKTTSKGDAANARTQTQTQLEVVFQGCSEVAGICYPPARRVITLASGATDVKPQDAEAPGLKSLFKKQVSQ